MTILPDGKNDLPDTDLPDARVAGLGTNVAYIMPDGSIESAYGDDIDRTVRLVFYDDLGDMTRDDFLLHPETTYLLVLASFPKAESRRAAFNAALMSRP